MIIEEISSIATDSNLQSILTQSGFCTANLFDFINCLINIITLLGGAWCFLQLRKLKEKRLDALFCFLVKLRLRLHYLSTTLEKYGDCILEVLYNPTIRNVLDADSSSSFEPKLVKSYLISVKETLGFLMDTDNQIPIKLGWIDEYNMFVEFLDVYIKTEDKNFYLWESKDALDKDNFSEKHIKNMKQMIADINKEQTKIEKLINRKTFKEKIISLFSNKFSNK